jgi:hypothetical protein
LGTNKDSTSRKGAKTGRLVLNHSTHLPGLIPLLTKLAEQPDIKTVTPGRLARVQGRTSPLKIKVSVPVSGGYKLQARAQSSVQEVFVVTDLKAEALQEILERLQKE